MPRDRPGAGGEIIIDPFYPDGYVSTDQDRRQIIAQKNKYQSAVGSINFKFPLKNYKQGYFEGNKDTISAIREDLKVLLMTQKGERLMHKNMGTSLPILDGQLFEPIHKVEVIEKIKLDIQAQIESYMPFLSLQNINIFTNEEDDNLKNNQVRVSMSYLIKGTQAMMDNYSFTITAA